MIRWQGREPVGDRTGPDDRRPLDEQDVSGEHDARFGNVDDRVPRGVSGPDLDQLDAAVGHRQLPLAVERLGGEPGFDLREVKRAEGPPRERRELRGTSGRAGQSMHQGWGSDVHVVDRSARGDDRDAVGQQLVAEPVVAVAVRVHGLGDRTALRRRAHLLEHGPGQREIEQRVHEQGLALAGDQPSVAPAPGPVWLEVCIQPVSQLMQTAAIGDVHGATVLPQRPAAKPDRPGRSLRCRTR